MNTLKSHMRSLVVLSLVAIVSGSACKARFHRVPKETRFGTHRISVRPYCDSSTSNSLDEFEKDGRRIVSHEFICGDTTVLVRGNMLSVNGKSYGTLNPRDWIAVDYGKVRVNSEVRAEVQP